MPDSFGLPTDEEIRHYERVLIKTEDVVRLLQVSPPNNTQIQSSHGDLDRIYNEFKNPHLWGNSSGHTPLWDIPRILKKCIDGGMTADLLPMLQNEIVSARENLVQLKKAKENNPMKSALSYLLGKRD